MTRYQGRVVVKKVTEEGKYINGSEAKYREENPGKLVFDSMPEFKVWKYLTDEGIAFLYQPSINLFDGIKTTEFKDGELKTISQRKIGYTPDFFLPDYDCYLEVKGYADELFKLRWKLFKLKNYKGYIVFSLEEAVELLDLLKLITPEGDTSV